MAASDRARALAIPRNKGNRSFTSPNTAHDGKETAATLRNVTLDHEAIARQGCHMTIASLLDPITGKPGPVRLEHAQDWMQGRTLYGGASALLAYTMATRAFTGLPPLRAAQVGFVAPVGEEIELTAEIIRQGRSVTQVRSEIRSDGKVALTGVWLFAAAREANASHPSQKPEDWPGEPLDNEIVPTHEGAPSFIRNNFELRYGQVKGADAGASVRRWARLTEDHSLDPVAKLVLMGDVMPPGAMRVMQRLGPISSINWSFNVLDPETVSSDGWYLAENASQHAAAGYSSERLRMWDASGNQVLDGLQCVAVFG